jgi:hypothetical protein
MHPGEGAMKGDAMTKKFLMLLLMLALAAPASAVQKGRYSIDILVNGRPLEEYAARGTTYIEALEGREYSIRLRNHTGRRIAVALAVDGLNTIDAKATTASDASKWIIGPYGTITIEGWQTGPDTARRFFFTTEENSYGAWLGKTRNLGVITAAVFREKRPPAERVWREERKKAAPSRCAEGESLGLSDDMAATGIGRETGHSVRRIEFEAERNPAAVMRIRYEYHDALVRLGVLDDALARRERARGFEDMEFAPDPYGR